MRRPGRGPAAVARDSRRDAPSLAIGNTKRKVAPLPASELAEIAPPCSSTSDFAIARPRPVPPTAWVSPLWARQKRSKTWSSSSGSRPGPLSETVNSICLPTLARGQAHPRALVRVLVGVGEQVGQHLADAVRVGLDVGEVLLDADGELLSCSSKLGRIWLPTRWPRPADRRRLRVDAQLARVAAGQVEQVVDHLLQLAGAVRDDLGRLQLAGVQRLGVRRSASRRSP